MHAQTWSPAVNDLRAALQEGTLALHYQPIYGTDDLELVAYESLLRWTHPIHGMIAPSAFVPMAEKSGLVHDLGLWVLRQACRERVLLKSRYVGVNVSAIQLQRSDFADNFIRIIREEGVDPQHITVEITETVPLETGRIERQNLEDIRELGSYLAIDDYGTGYAEYKYIENFPFNVVKIDKSFIKTILTSKEAEAFIVSVCDIGHKRDIVVVAEGVETLEQLDALRRLGCSRAQGFLLGRPAPAGSHELFRLPHSR